MKGNLNFNTQIQEAIYGKAAQLLNFKNERHARKDLRIYLYSMVPVMP